jgi:hypothetical protein
MHDCGFGNTNKGHKLHLYNGQHEQITVAYSKPTLKLSFESKTILHNKIYSHLYSSRQEGTDGKKPRKTWDNRKREALNW